MVHHEMHASISEMHLVQTNDGGNDVGARGIVSTGIRYPIHGLCSRISQCLPLLDLSRSREGGAA